VCKRELLLVVLLVGTVTGSLSIVFFLQEAEDWAGPRVLQVLPTDLVYLIAAHHDLSAGSVFNRYLLPALVGLLLAGVLTGILVLATAQIRSSVSLRVAVCSGVLAGFTVTGWSLFRVGVWDFGFLLSELFSGLVSSAFIALASGCTFIGGRTLLNRIK